MTYHGYSLRDLAGRHWVLTAELAGELRDSGAAQYCQECSHKGRKHTVLHARTIDGALNALAERKAHVAKLGHPECFECGTTLAYKYFTQPGDPELRWWCRDCAFATFNEPPDDDEPPGAGADPYGRPSPTFHPEYWQE